MNKQQSPLILPFTDIRAADLPLVGGKGANLGELTHAGFPIPPGFCVTTVAFQQFMDVCPADLDITAADLYKRLDQVAFNDVEAVRRVGKQIRQTLLELPMPQNIAKAVHAQWQKLGAEHAYAVRSSATAEDLPDASFAGQQDTYLNVRGEAELLDAVHRCWVSLFTDRAIIYRGQNHFAHQDVQLSVVVQQMVMAETSGILFTADPLTGHRHTASIDASFGLGEALVGGLVSPDAYRVDKRTQTIVDRKIAEKQLAILPNEDGGVRQETLSTEQRDQTALSDDEILALTAMGTEVEAHYDSPQDIEWAISDGQLYLLQARPITSLFPIDGLASPDGSLHIYFSSGHQQMMTDAISPLGRSNLRCFMPGKRAPGEPESMAVRSSGGRLFIDATAALHHPILRRIVLAISSQFDALAPEAARMAMQRPTFKRQQHLKPPISMLGQLVRIPLSVLSSLWWRDLNGSAAKVNELIEQELASIRSKIDQASTAEDRLQAMINVMRSFFPVILKWMPIFAAGTIANRLLQRVGTRWANPADLNAYDLGLPGNVVTEMNMAVGDLADLARQSPQLVALFEQLGNESAESDSQAWLAEAAQAEAGKPFMQAWDAFIEQYGARGPSEIDIMAARWYEEPLPILQVIASHLQQDKGSHRAQHQQLGLAREAAVTRLLEQSRRGLFGGLRARLVRRLIHVSHQGSILREHHKYLVVQTMRIIKEELKEMADRFVETNKLSAQDDIWFLTWPELLALSRSKSDESSGVVAHNAVHARNRRKQILPTRALVAERRAEHIHFQKLTPPLVITSDGETPVVQYSIADAPPGALVGNAVSAGVVEGTVHVIHDPQAETLSPGEILVAPFTDPGWTPLFINAAGLIMEVGGAMTHGSVVAREYGIPAIVGVQGATETLQTGQQVRIDGNRGIIEVI